MIQHFNANETGRDHFVGDIHGRFDLLQEALEKVNFDPAQDRIFSVGDLVDRGQYSMECLFWLAQPYFHAVRGNHEQWAIDASHGLSDIACHIANGGKWFIDLAHEQQLEFARVFDTLPLAMEIDVIGKDRTYMIGVVHAEVPDNSWGAFHPANAVTGAHHDALVAQALWSREKWRTQNSDKVFGIDMVVVGHTVVPKISALGNVMYIDTGAVYPGGYLSTLELQKLK